MLFEKQKYQEDCVGNIITVLESADIVDGIVDGICPQKLKDGVSALHAKGDIFAKNKTDKLQLDVLMETGTGKTFTYLKTMYEMNKHFGLNKFLIFVPRLAIRAGIVQNIELTADYFFQEYGKRIKKHTYGNSGLNEVESYIRNEREFSILILTGQSIAKVETENRNKAKLRLIRKDENLFGAESPIEAISKLKPVVFIDEPHLLTGEGFSDSYNKFFANSLLLRFGATFPTEIDNKLSNVVYTLDSITAFCDYLVKKISVTTITDDDSTLKFYRSDRTETRYPLTLCYFKNGVEYRSYLDFDHNIAAITGDKNHDFHAIRITDGEVILSNRERRALSSNSYILTDATTREMIKRTIAIHFEKEEALFRQNIKTLSLFFIPNIADYRDEENPRIKNIFEQEYKKQRAEKLKEDIDSAYRDYLNQDYDDKGELCVHQGYFSGDKGSKEERENYGVNLILNDKTTLLSTAEPLRFIFSVWALQEGWDNPNIFNICKLAATEKEIKRRQQVGRGLRLAVDNSGRRHTIKHCSGNKDAFYKINTLDVIVSGHEKNFIEGIQSEIIGDSITSNRLTRNALKEMGLNGSEQVSFIDFLEKNDIIVYDENTDDVWDIKQPIADFIENNKDELPDKIKPKYDILIKGFKNAVDFSITNRNKEADKIGIRTEKFEQFEELWKTITRRAKIVYGVIDDERLIHSVKAAFDQETIDPLRIKLVKKTYNHTTNEIVTELEENLDDIKFFQTSNYEKFIADFANREELPLYFCLNLFNVLDKNKIKNNPRKAYHLLAKIIKEEIHRSIIQQIGYEFSGEIAIDTRSIFYDNGNPKNNIEAREIGKYTDRETQPPEHYLYDKIVYDSKIELDVAKADPRRSDGDKITVFAKLPKLSIPTPFKSYNPDFAYFIERQSGEQLFLIVETKGYNKEGDIPADEKTKTKYAERFFEIINEQVEDTEVVYQKRINREKLSDLLERMRG